MKLEDLLRARLGHAFGGRAHLHLSADRVFLTLGALGDHPRVSFRVDGDDLVLVDPKPEAEAEPTPNSDDAGNDGAGDQGGSYNGGGAAEQPEALDDMTKAELVEFAKAKNLNVNTSANKADLLAAIKAALASPPSE